MPTQFVKGSQLPQLQMLTATVLPLPEDTSVQPDGLIVNARIHPKGRPCTWRIEYGATTSYGSATSDRQLPGKLAAVYKEDWNSGLGGWLADISLTHLTHNSGGGYAEHAVTSSGNDDNHLDGVGVVMLGPIRFIGRNTPYDSPLLGGYRPDLRGAVMSFKVRGHSVNMNGATLCPWVQFDRDPRYIDGSSYATTQRRPNWAYSSESINSKLSSGNWEDVAITFKSNSELWTFGGRDQYRVPVDPRYVYGELDSGLSAVTCDMILMMINVDTGTPPVGTIDYDDFELRYRNNSVCADSNGGNLAAAPGGGSDPEVLTDGYMHGSGHVWTSGASPSLPMDFEYTFANPVTLDMVVVRNNPDYPAKEVELFVSEDDGANWTSLGTREIPDTHAYGDNFLREWWSNTGVAPGGVDAYSDPYFDPIYADPVNRMRVRINTKWSGVSSDPVGLGSIEAFGTGADYGTDNDWYDVSQDLILASGTHHYRVVAETDRGTAYGPDQTVTVP